MVFEFCDHDLFGLLEDEALSISPAQAKLYLKLLLEALAFCHARGLMHRDIKGANVLVTNRGEVKLTDFGLARVAEPGEGDLTNRVVSLWYRAPELLFGDTA
jgi:cyclin-dependent kinase 12/13